MSLKPVTLLFLATLLASCAHEATRGQESDADSGKAVADLKSERAAYFVFNYRITHRDAYDEYLAQVPGLLEAHGAEVVVADFESDIVEGSAGHVTVVLKFASEEAARRWYHSSQYQKIIGLRLDNSEGIATLSLDRN